MIDQYFDFELRSQLARGGRPFLEASLGLPNPFLALTPAGSASFWLNRRHVCLSCSTIIMRNRLAMLVQLPTNFK